MMRVTTQMVNASARKAGLPELQQSLLDYLNNDSGSDSSLVSSLKSKSNNKIDTVNSKMYEKQEKAAKELETEVQKFTLEGKESLFEQAKESGDTSQLCKAVKTLADKYNALVSSMKGSTGVLDKFYKQSMDELLGEYKTALEDIGITVGSDGSMKVNQNTLNAATFENLEKALGSGSEFPSKLSFLASRVENNASASMESITNSYLSNGSSTNGYTSKYDFWA